MTDESKKLYRSRTDRLVGGVCAGLGKYLGVDPTVVRLVFIITLFFTFTASALVYFAFWMVIPEEPSSSESKVEVIEK